MVGAMVLARATSDEALAAELLSAARKGVIEGVRAASRSTPKRSKPSRARRRLA
jgi:hypothetical protein